MEFFVYYVHEKLRTGWKENLKNLSEHALLLVTSEQQYLADISSKYFSHSHAILTYFLSFSSGLLLPLTKDRQSTRDLFEKSINKFDSKKWHLSSSNNTGFEPIYGEVSHDDVFLTTKSGL